MIVIVMIAFTTNLGKLVTERIAIQNTVDLAAYSGAATQAGVLNEIRADNQTIWETHMRVRQLYEPSEYSPIYFLPATRCPPCAYGPNMCPGNIVAPTGEAVYYGNLPIVTMKVINIQANLMPRMGMRARSAAQDSADTNYPGVSLQFLGTSLMPPPLKNDTLDWDYKGWAFTAPAPGCPPGPSGAMLVTHHTAPSWFFRDNRVQGEVMFAVGARGTPETNFLGNASGTYIGNYFGDRNELRAYAAALPHAGKVGTIQGGQFNTALENRWRGGSSFISSDNPRDVEGPGVVRPSRVIGGSYNDYKARYVGIFESRAQFQRGGPLTTTVPDGMRMAH